MTAVIQQNNHWSWLRRSYPKFHDGVRYHWNCCLNAVAEVRYKRQLYATEFCDNLAMLLPTPIRTASLSIGFYQQLPFGRV
jgi:hypothetical protein